MRLASYVLLLILSATAAAVLSLTFTANAADAVKYRVLDMEYESSSTRTSKEASVLEWGHSAIISALYGAVSPFVSQTSRGAFFKVETGIVLANPINDVGRKGRKRMGYDSGNGNNNDSDNEWGGGLLPLDNADEVAGNVVVMTNDADLTGIQMTRIA